MKKCPFCAEEIPDEAIKCKYCKSMLDGKISQSFVPSRSIKKWHQKTPVTLFVAAILIVIGFGFIHIITGSNLEYAPFHIALKHSFGYSETFINIDKIIGMPKFAVMMKYPLGYKILSEKGYIESASDDTSNGTPIITHDKYKQIQNGMSYSQVVAIIGAEGEEMSRNKIDGVPGVMESIETVMYQWVNSNGSNMNAIFQNNKLIQKAQFGLK